MEKKDNLPNIIALISIILFLIFIFTISKPEENLQGGDIQHAIETNQY
jgi:biopolymer transport protein ExbD